MSEERRKLFKTLEAPEKVLRELLVRLPKGLRIEERPLEESLYHVLAEDVYAPISNPPEPRSLVDGYAVRFECVSEAREDNPVRLPVVDRVRIGEVPSTSISGCEAIEVDTGAVIPPGADAVVPVEYTRESAGVVEVYKSVVFGENIAWPGSDIAEGELIAHKGTVVTPRLVGALASLGVTMLKVYSKPSVCIVSTGVELTPPGEPLGPGRIYESNSYSLRALLHMEGFPYYFYGIVPDDYEAIEKAVVECLQRCDVVIVTGGTSAGPQDLVYRVLGDLGEVLVHGLKLKPGKPTVVALVDGKPVFGLPGNPVSCINVYKVLVRPVLWHLAGGSAPQPPQRLKAKLGSIVVGVRGRRFYQPVYLALGADGAFYAYPIRFESYMIVTYARSDGVIVVPEYIHEGLDEGVEVTVETHEAVVARCNVFGEEFWDPKFEGCRWIGGGTALAVKAVKHGAADVATLSPIHPAYEQPPHGYKLRKVVRRLAVVGDKDAEVVATYSSSTSLSIWVKRLFKNAKRFVMARNTLMAAQLVAKGYVEGSIVLLEVAKKANLEPVEILEEELVIAEREVSPGGGSS